MEKPINEFVSMIKYKQLIQENSEPHMTMICVMMVSHRGIKAVTSATDHRASPASRAKSKGDSSESERMNTWRKFAGSRSSSCASDCVYTNENKHKPVASGESS